MKLAVITLFVIISASESRIPLPSYIKTCRKTDPNLNECFVRNANLAIKCFAKGDPDYGIKSLLPIKWKHLLEFHAPDLHFSLLDIDVYGAENLKVIEPNIDFNKNLIQFNFTGPLLIWKGHYIATRRENGKNIEKNGHVEFQFINGKYLMTFQYDLQSINGLKYAKITKSQEDVLAVQFKYKPDISDTNGLSIKDWEKLKDKFINQEILDSAAELIAGYINKIFDVIPFNEIFT